MSRAALLKISGAKSDRAMRKNITTAKLNGIPIANAQDGKGYFIPATKAEVQAQIRQNDSRAKVLLAQQKALKVLLRQMEDSEMYGRGLDLDEGEVG